MGNHSNLQRMWIPHFLYYSTSPDEEHFLHYIVVWPTMSCFADWSKCRRCWLYRSIQWFLPTSFSLFTPIDYWATDNINSELPYLSISAVQQAIHPFSEFYDNPSITVLFSFFILFTDRQTDKRRWKQYVIPRQNWRRLLPLFSVGTPPLSAECFHDMERLACPGNSVGSSHSASTEIVSTLAMWS